MMAKVTLVVMTYLWMGGKPVLARREADGR